MKWSMSVRCTGTLQNTIFNFLLKCPTIPPGYVRCVGGGTSWPNSLTSEGEEGDTYEHAGRSTYSPRYVG